MVWQAKDLLSVARMNNLAITGIEATNNITGSVLVTGSLLQGGTLRVQGIYSDGIITGSNKIILFGAGGTQEIVFGDTNVYIDRPSGTNVLGLHGSSGINTYQILTLAGATGADQRIAIGDTTITISRDAGGMVLTGSVRISGGLTVGSTTDSTSKDTGAIICEGGVGIEKKLYVGTDLHVVGQVYVPNMVAGDIFDDLAVIRDIKTREDGLIEPESLPKWFREGQNLNVIRLTSLLLGAMKQHLEVHH